MRSAVGTVIADRPPPKSVQAELSGSSAIAGFRPHRTHRAALPQWALQKGLEEFYLGISEGRRKSFRNSKHYRRRKRWLA